MTKQELREKIAELNLRYLTLAKARDDYSPATLETELTDQILALIKEADYVKLAEDQSLPDNPFWHQEDREFEAYCAGHNDMVSKNWRRVKIEGGE